MTTATITSKGQLTIPKEVREMLRLHSGDKVGFVLNRDDEMTLRPMTKSVDQVFGKLYRKDQKAKTIGEMKESIKARMKSL